MFRSLFFKTTTDSQTRKRKTSALASTTPKAITSAPTPTLPTTSIHTQCIDIIKFLMGLQGNGDDRMPGHLDTFQDALTANDIDIGILLFYLNLALTETCYDFLNSLDKLFADFPKVKNPITQLDLIRSLKFINNICYNNTIFYIEKFDGSETARITKSAHQHYFGCVGKIPSEINKEIALEIRKIVNETLIPLLKAFEINRIKKNTAELEQFIADQQKSYTQKKAKIKSDSSWRSREDMSLPIEQQTHDQEYLRWIETQQYEKTYDALVTDCFTSDEKFSLPELNSLSVFTLKQSEFKNLLTLAVRGKISLSELARLGKDKPYLLQEIIKNTDAITRLMDCDIPFTFFKNLTTQKLLILSQNINLCLPLAKEKRPLDDLLSLNHEQLQYLKRLSSSHFENVLYLLNKKIITKLSDLEKLNPDLSKNILEHAKSWTTIKQNISLKEIQTIYDKLFSSVDNPSSILVLMNSGLSIEDILQTQHHLLNTGDCFGIPSAIFEHALIVSRWLKEATSKVHLVKDVFTKLASLDSESFSNLIENDHLILESKTPIHLLIDIKDEETLSLVLNNLKKLKSNANEIAHDCKQDVDTVFKRIVQLKYNEILIAGSNQPVDIAQWQKIKANMIKEYNSQTADPSPTVVSTSAATMKVG
jgi:hypothetical protein